MENQKKQVTFSISEDIKKQFQIECLINGNDMSSAVQSMMASYTRVSKELRLKQASELKEVIDEK